MSQGPSKSSKRRRSLTGLGKGFGLNFEFPNTGLQIRVCTGKSFFLLLNQNICCGYSKEPSQGDGSLEHPEHMLKLIVKEINAILGAQTILIWTHTCIIF